MCNPCQKMGIWGQKSIFCLVIAIFVDGTNDHYTRGYNFPIGTTPKKFSVSELGVIFWGSPLFLAVFGHWRVRRATTLSFGPISTKLGRIVRTIKKMTQKDNGPGPGRNYGETGVFTFGQKLVFWRAGWIIKQGRLPLTGLPKGVSRRTGWTWDGTTKQRTGKERYLVKNIEIVQGVSF